MLSVPNEIRILIKRDRRNGDSAKEIAARYEIGLSTVYRLAKRPDVLPKAQRHGPRCKLTADDDNRIKELLEKDPSATLTEIVAGLRLDISISALCRHINKKLHMRRKKKSFLPAESQTEKNLKLRAEWELLQKGLDPGKLVFLDEAGFSHALVQMYGRAYKGKRCYGLIPDARFDKTSIVDAIRLDGTCVPMMFSGALNGPTFLKYISEWLAPTLRPGDIVIMDNLSSHKVAGVAAAIAAMEASVLYLPPYSPDYNPIELSWSKIKANVSKLQKREDAELYDSIALSYDEITAKDMSGWFKHCGYSQPTNKAL